MYRGSVEPGLWARIQRRIFAVNIEQSLVAFVERGTCTARELSESCSISIEDARSRLVRFEKLGLASKSKMSDVDVWAALKAGKGGAGNSYTPTDKAKEAVATRLAAPPAPPKRK
jgi:hypothetical protein